jgi:nucleoporin NUP82
MPKVNSYAPAWLCRPSPGASLFTSSSLATPAQNTQPNPKSATPTGATRTIAKRGNEVFAVIDNEIRWSNLARVKDQWQQQARQKKASTGQTKELAKDGEIPSYRVSAVREKKKLFTIRRYS